MATTTTTKFTELRCRNNVGQDVDFNDYAGKVILIVNVARLWDVQEVPDLVKLGIKYKTDLQLLFFPCNQFCKEEPGEPSEIADFYVKKHGLPSDWLMERGDVNGANTQPTYAFLKSFLPGDIEWNFNKFVIGRDGNPLQRFGQGVKPDQLEEMVASWIR